MHPNNEAKNDMRFSDEKLYNFQEEFREHVIRCEQRFNDGDAQFKQLIDAQQKNTDAIALLIEETREVVQLHRDIQGTARVGKSLQNFIIWLLKWGAVGTGIAVALKGAADFIGKFW